MTKGGLFVFLLFGIELFAQAQPATKQDTIWIDYEKRRQAAIGTPFRNFEAKLNGLSFSNKDFKGKTVFINFWFETCPPCVAEFDGLNELYKKTKDIKDFLFLSFTFETPENIERFRAKYGLLYPIVPVSEKECHGLNFELGFPTSMMVSKKGKICYVSSGGVIDKKKASEWVMEELYSGIIEQTKN